MNIKTKWNNLSIWKKGAIIGFIISTLLAILFATISYFNFIQNPTIEVGCASQESCAVPFIFVFLGMLVYSIPMVLIGGITGYFIQKRNK